MVNGRLAIGHYNSRNTGVTVFLLSKASTCAYFLCGGAPATREIAVLNPGHLVSQVNALLFTGGSAYGLGAADGVMRWLHERGQGFQTRHTIVPIVPTAAIYDLYESQSPPSPDDAYKACENAIPDNNATGLIGVGAGARVGKLATESMPGGFGWARVLGADGLIVDAYAVVNCVGDVLNEQGQIIAGAKDASGRFINTAESLLKGLTLSSHLQHQQTTLIAVFTNANLSHAQLQRVAKMASGGLSRAISPALTCYDGDIIFATSLGDLAVSDLAVGNAAAKVVQQAIMAPFVKNRN